MAEMIAAAAATPRADYAARIASRYASRQSHAHRGYQTIPHSTNDIILR